MTHNDDFALRVKLEARRRAEFQEAIDRFVRDHKEEDEMSAADIGDLGGCERLLTYKQDDLASARAYMAAFPRENAKQCVRQIIKWLSDNGRGYGTFSVPRLAQYLGRSESHIWECIDQLLRKNLIRQERIPGHPTRYWPVISKIFAENYQTTWFLDHWAPPSRPRGRPRKEGNVIHAFGMEDEAGAGETARRAPSPENPKNPSPLCGGVLEGAVEKPSTKSRKPLHEGIAESLISKAKTRASLLT